MAGIVEKPGRGIVRRNSEAVMVVVSVSRRRKKKAADPAFGEPGRPSLYVFKREADFTPGSLRIEEVIDPIPDFGEAPDNSSIA